MTLGEAVREAREGKGLSRRDVEDLTGISQSHQRYIETDVKIPGTRNLEALAKVLGSSILAAAFPDLVVIAPRSVDDSTEQATARKLGRPARRMTDRPRELVRTG